MDPQTIHLIVMEFGENVIHCPSTVHRDARRFGGLNVRTFNGSNFPMDSHGKLHVV